jgi:hypothetical protein
MAKTFFTERDVEDLYQRGIRVIDADDNVVLTDLAREKALALGMRVTRGGSSTSAAPQNGRVLSQDEIVAKVKAAVVARLGHGVDPTLLDAVIRRVVAQIK